MDLHFSIVKIMKGFYCFMLLSTMSLCDASELSLVRRNLRVEKHSNQMNKKTPLEFIESKDGDVIDCTHISDQPALDHPLLKNHEIQMRPSYHPEGLFEGKKLSNNAKDDTEPITQLWQLTGRCPEGTIPMRRAKQQETLRASFINSSGRKQFKSNINSSAMKKSESISLNGSTETEPTRDDDHEFVSAFVQGDKYYGAKATINVWEPQLQQPSELSSSQLWIEGDANSDSTLNVIQAGWIVDPEVYGDNRTRFFTYWTSDHFQSTGCFDMLCSGFVQTNNQIALGGSLSPISTINGNQSHDSHLTILIWKDPKQNAWWLQIGDGTLVGYWPASLFTHLARSASLVQWGGGVTNLQSDGQHTTTQMGSGHFPEEGAGVASFITDLQVVDSSIKLRTPSNIGTFATKPNCYNVTLEKSDEQGFFTLYGGPGRNPSCP